MPLVPVRRPNGPRLREIRTGKQIGITDLARRITRKTGRYRSPQSIRNLECGHAKFVGVGFITDIAEELGTSVAEITLPDDEETSDSANKAVA